LVVEVYPGRVAGPLPPWLFELNNSLPLNLQILAARGYAVLQPSVPLGSHGVAGDPMLDLPKGVLPAVDRAVELGVADPERVFLLGHSFGGYGGYGLISLTKRFRAAVALAGASDLVFQSALLEVGQGRLGAPPWRDAARYVRNSPIFYADRIETPLLIIQGDLDYVPIQQDEEMFTALYRQGKRARFVRYWGEGHILNSPANIRDMWGRIFAWFEEWAHGSSSAPGT
jgi:dipeptidyl aminopeptidase/acylaminoacyl peptidase